MNDKKPTKSVLANIALSEGVALNEICCICGSLIVVMIYKNSGVCCENHRKIRDNDLEPFKMVNLKIHEGEDR